MLPHLSLVHRLPPRDGSVIHLADEDTEVGYRQKIFPPLPGKWTSGKGDPGNLDKLQTPCRQRPFSGWKGGIAGTMLMRVTLCRMRFSYSRAPLS